MDAVITRKDWGTSIIFASTVPLITNLFGYFLPRLSSLTLSIIAAPTEELFKFVGSKIALRFFDWKYSPIAVGFLFGVIESTTYLFDTEATVSQRIPATIFHSFSGFVNFFSMRRGRFAQIVGLTINIAVHLAMNLYFK